MHVFVDYDGTITDLDTFDLLARLSAGDRAWEDLDAKLQAGVMTLRQALAAQAALLRCSLDEADEIVRTRTIFDPSFGHFAARCEHERFALTILSSGLGPLIERALARNNLSHVPLRANGAQPHASGWTMEFLDDSDYGHDKAKAVADAKANGKTVTYIGDGNSDYDAALLADRRFAKRSRPLEHFLRERGVPFTPFDSFAEVETALFGYQDHMYEKDAPEQSSTEREEAERLRQSEQQADQMDQPAAPGKSE